MLSNNCTKKRMSPFALLCEAALAFADVPAEDDEAYERARDNLRYAACRYASAGTKWARRGMDTSRGDNAPACPGP